MSASIWWRSRSPVYCRGFIEVWERNLLQRLLLFAALAIVFEPGRMVWSDEPLGQRRVSAAIEQVGRETERMVPSVHVHIVDPADYLERTERDDLPVLDMLGFAQQLGEDIPETVDPWTVRRIISDVSFGLFRGEMLVGLYSLSSGRVLCVVVPKAAPVTRSGIASQLSGSSEYSVPADVSTDAEDLYRFLLYHELAHCGETPTNARPSPRAEHSTYLAECRADTFATLMHGRRTTEDQLPRYVALLRQQGASIRLDAEHHTAAIIEATLVSLGSNPDLRKKGPGALLRIAREIVSAHAWDLATYEAHSKQGSE